MSENLHKKINSVIHQPVRLQIMTFLHMAKKANFSELKRELNITDGNLGSHLGKLEEHKFIKSKKKFVMKKPSTVVSITEKGENELIKYLAVIKSIIENAP